MTIIKTITILSRTYVSKTKCCSLCVHIGAVLVQCTYQRCATTCISQSVSNESVGVTTNTTIDRAERVCTLVLWPGVTSSHNGSFGAACRSRCSSAEYRASPLQAPTLSLRASLDCATSHYCTLTQQQDSVTDTRCL